MSNDGKGGTAPDPLTWSGGAWRKDAQTEPFSLKFGLASSPYYLVDWRLARLAAHHHVGYVLSLNLCIGFLLWTN